MIKNIFLDVGQILVSVNLHLFVSLCAQKSIYNKDYIQSYINNSEVITSFGLGRIDEKEFLARLASELKYQGSIDELSLIWSDIFELIYINIDLVKNLGRKYQTVAVSNTNSLHARRLAKMGIYNLFKVVVLSYKVGARKPDEEIYNKALEKSGALAKESIFLDDQKENVLTAKRLGFKAKTVPSPDKLKKVLNDLGVVI